MLKNILMLLQIINPFAGLINVVNRYLNKSFLKNFINFIYLTLIQAFFNKLSILVP